MSRDTERSPKVSSQDKSRTESSLDRAIARKAVGGSSRSEASLESKSDSHPSATDNAAAKKNKQKPFGILSRSKSLHEEQSPRAPSPTNKSIEAEKPPIQTTPPKSEPPPAENTDRSFRSMMSSTARQRSEDRQPSATREPAQPKEGSKLRDHKEHSRSQTMKEPRDGGRPQPSFSSSLREGGGNTFLNNLKSSATKGAGALSKGLFGKGGRTNSHEKDTPVDDEHYQLKVLTLPLMEQTRLTRISKKLEDSKDKTEFWMPAFPWRAIDYLNYKGSDVEGLYRVPGSGPQIKKWQRRFDEDFDIDLFEQDDLYDINIIGSMLKAWLRELPDELFPKTSQDRVARECPDQEEVPQLLIDELSNLSPFNYYLLFAITCHLSLLLAHSSKNKMDFRNLCICFQPCMKIDAYCFKFLVCNWRECWQGCKTEQFYIEQEYMLFDMITPSSAEGQSSIAIESHDERNVSSSDSSKPSSVSIDQAGQKSGSSQGKKLPRSQNQSTSGPVKTILTVVQERTPTTPPRRNNDMRPLSPIKPLSPIGF
ncbi:RhoGAP domain-containing protein [Diplocarpon rosae]|nr:RhoGAP domain-containing protein [Diplocarpon rosae]